MTRGTLKADLIDEAEELFRREDEQALLDTFAGQALPWCLSMSQPSPYQSHFPRELVRLEDAVKKSYDIAAAMLQERKRRREGK